jgi:hypothetical protein
MRQMKWKLSGIRSIFGSLDKSGKCREHEIECYRLPQRTNFRFSVCFLSRLWRLRAADFCVLKTRHEVMSSGTSAFPCTTLSPVMFVLRFPITRSLFLCPSRGSYGVACEFHVPATSNRIRMEKSSHPPSESEARRHSAGNGLTCRKFFDYLRCTTQQNANEDE